MGGEVTPAIRRHSLTPTILCACSELVPQTQLWYLGYLFLINTYPVSPRTSEHRGVGLH